MIANHIRVARRFRGPPQSANGGYVAGLMAAAVNGTVTVRLRQPPPLDIDLQLVGDAVVELRSESQRIATAQPATLHWQPTIPPPSHGAALEASRYYSGHTHPVFPGCFVCGTDRAPGDGLRIFAGRVSEPGEPLRVAAPWTPHRSLAGSGTVVLPQFLFAALDCPGFCAVSTAGSLMLLAEFTVKLVRSVHPGERCVLTGEALGSAGRKHRAGTALYGEDGELRGCAEALWIEPRGSAAD